MRAAVLTPSRRKSNSLSLLSLRLMLLSKQTPAPETRPACFSCVCVYACVYVCVRDSVCCSEIVNSFKVMYCCLYLQSHGRSRRCCSCFSMTRPLLLLLFSPLLHLSRPLFDGSLLTFCNFGPIRVIFMRTHSFAPHVAHLFVTDKALP